MEILSHRGYWKAAEEKNTVTAFRRSFSLGFGVELDVRDFGQELVISHDIPTGGELDFKNFLQLVNSESTAAGKEGLSSIAINIKSDGLAYKIFEEIMMYPCLNCFAFDMSLPDMREYIRLGIPVFARLSEVEREAIWLDRSDGVWLDAFESEWYGSDLIEELLSSGKRVCIVSPELHQRDHMPLWERLTVLADESGLMLCTDFPEQAKDFFLIERGIQ